MFGKEKKEKKEKRFVVKESQVFFESTINVVVDKYTGVNYLMTACFSSVNITPLLDSNGDVVVDKKDELYY